MGPHEREEVFEETTDRKHLMQIFLFLLLIGFGSIFLIVFGRIFSSELADGELSVPAGLRTTLGALLLLQGYLRLLALTQNASY